MKITADHPSFISYLNDVTNQAIENIDINRYFSFTNEEKIKAQFIVFTLIEKKIKSNITILSEQLKTFLYILIKKNENIERYETSALLNDIIKNFDEIIERKETISKLRKTANPTVKK